MTNNKRKPKGEGDKQKKSAEKCPTHRRLISKITSPHRLKLASCQFAKFKWYSGRHGEIDKGNRNVKVGPVFLLFLKLYFPLYMQQCDRDLVLLADGKDDVLFIFILPNTAQCSPTCPRVPIIGTELLLFGWAVIFDDFASLR